MSKSFADILTLMHENNVEMVNFKMADAKGKYHQVTIPAGSFSIDLIQKGINIDTNTYSCVPANNGDAIFIPDMDSAVLDQGSIISTVVVSGELRYFNGKNKVTNVAPEASKGDKITSLIFSIVALSCGGSALLLSLGAMLFACCCFWAYGAGIYAGFIWGICSLICAIPGIVFGVLGKKKCAKSGRAPGMAVAGLIMSIVSCIMTIIPIILLVLLIALIVILYVIIFVIYLLVMCLAVLTMA